MLSRTRCVRKAGLLGYTDGGQEREVNMADGDAPERGGVSPAHPPPLAQSQTAESEEHCEKVSGYYR